MPGECRRDRVRGGGRAAHELARGRRRRPPDGLPDPLGVSDTAPAVLVVLHHAADPPRRGGPARLSRRRDAGDVVRPGDLRDRRRRGAGPSRGPGVTSVACRRPRLSGRLRLPRRRPSAGVAVALITLVNAICWGLIVPPLNVPDETAHLYYAQYVAETGKLPQDQPGDNWYSAELRQLIADEWLYFVVGQKINRPPTDAAAK